MLHLLEPSKVAQTLSIIHWKPLLQRLYGVWTIAFFVLCFFGPTYAPILFSVYFLWLHYFYVVNMIRTFYGAYKGYHMSVKQSKTDWVQRYCELAGVASPLDPRHDLPFSLVQHVIIIPSFKESLETLCDTLDTLASHEMALTQYKVPFAHVGVFGNGRS